MHDVTYRHQHELKEHDFLGCCKDCRRSLAIIKPHIMAFGQRIRQYDRKMLESLSPGDLYRLYQLLDDLAHLEAGEHLAGLILDEPEIRRVLPLIRTYYRTFFSIHEVHLAEELLASSAPWKTLQSFPLYPRYEALVRGQMTACHIGPDSRLAFIGCGPVPTSLILLSRLFGIRSVGLDTSAEAVDLSQKVLRCLRIEKDIQVVRGDETSLRKLNWDGVLVAALALPKDRIFRNLRQILREKGKRGAPVVFRTYTGMRRVLHAPVSPTDTQGFKIVETILPTGRVNNTTITAKLDE